MLELYINEELLRFYIDSVSEDYRNEYISEYSKRIQKELSDSIRIHNNELLVSYNDSVIKVVNDSNQSCDSYSDKTS